MWWHIILHVCMYSRSKVYKPALEQHLRTEVRNSNSTLPHNFASEDRQPWRFLYTLYTFLWGVQWSYDMKVHYILLLWSHTRLVFLLSTHLQINMQHNMKKLHTYMGMLHIKGIHTPLGKIYLPYKGQATKHIVIWQLHISYQIYKFEFILKNFSIKDISAWRSNFFLMFITDTCKMQWQYVEYYFTD